ncbi:MULTISPECIES: hypothetical protein [Bacillus cereus group]|nr:MULTISPECIES: hypothetical protein [Bacillus cereus group]MCU5667835.1 hypothetical protein [Bacillus cereus]MEC2870786.1 hypothetical protein [Bacillus cereus]MEE3956989.1 hypothetical protein [Bacillus thuringiensis]TKH47901.1 hypothetical protein FC698_14115 [Bacillus cereus]
MKRLIYAESLYHNPEKPRVRSIVGSFYLEKRESEIEYEMFKEKFRSKCNDLIEKIIQFRTDEQWSIEEINEWLSKGPFVN